MRAQVRTLVDELSPLDEVEIAHQADVIGWIDSGTELFRLAKPATPPKHLVAYCVLVDPVERQLLLVDHRDAQRWLPTGGHVDPGEHPAVAARREIAEELGIDPSFHDSFGDRPVMVTVTETAGVSETHTDVSLWFAFAGSVADNLIPDPGEFVEARWWNFDDVQHRTGTRFDPHLPRFIQKLVEAAS